MPPAPFTKSFGQTFEIWLSTFCIYHFCWGSTHVIVKAQQHPTYHTICFLLTFFSPEDLYKRNTLQKSRLYTEWFLVISKNTIHLTLPFHDKLLPHKLFATTILAKLPPIYTMKTRARRVWGRWGGYFLSFYIEFFAFLIYFFVVFRRGSRPLPRLGAKK